MEICKFCKKEMISGHQSISRWFEDDKNCAAHTECDRAQEDNVCPRCKSKGHIRLDDTIHCEICGWPK